MKYKKGQLLSYDYPVRVTKNIANSSVIHSFHRIVVLHQRATPYNTVLIAPITEASTLAKYGNIPPNYIKMSKTDYPAFLSVDSYINPDMTMVVDEAELSELIKGQSNIKISGILNSHDLVVLNYKLLITYELKKYVENDVEIAVTEELSNVIEFIDTDIKSRIETLCRKVNDEKLLIDILTIINDLIDEIRKAPSELSYSLPQPS